MASSAPRQVLTARDHNAPLRRTRRTKWGAPVRPPTEETVNSFVTCQRGSVTPVQEFSASGSADAWMPWTEAQHPRRKSGELSFATTVPCRNFTRHSPGPPSPGMPPLSGATTTATVVSGSSGSPGTAVANGILHFEKLAAGHDTQLQELRTQLDEATEVNTALKAGMQDAANEAAEMQARHLNWRVPVFSFFLFSDRVGCCRLLCNQSLRRVSRQRLG